MRDCLTMGPPCVTGTPAVHVRARRTWGADTAAARLCEAPYMHLVNHKLLHGRAQGPVPCGSGTA